MAYDVEKLYNTSIKAIQADEYMHFLADVYVRLGVSKSTFFRLFPVGSNQYNEIEALLIENRVKVKMQMRRDWAKEKQSPALQIGLYKLIGSDEERNHLTQSRVEVSGEVTETRRLDVSKLSTSALLELKKTFYDAIPEAEAEELN